MILVKQIVMPIDTHLLIFTTNIALLVLTRRKNNVSFYLFMIDNSQLFTV